MQNCLNCNNPVRSHDMAFWTRVKPETFRCDTCDITWLEFEVLGESPLVLNLAEWSRSQPFTDWFEEKLEERRARLGHGSDRIQ